MSNARNLQTLGLVCFLVGFSPVWANERSLMWLVILMLPPAAIFFVAGLYLNGWKFYQPDQKTEES